MPRVIKIKEGCWSYGHLSLMCTRVDTMGSWTLDDFMINFMSASTLSMAIISATLFENHASPSLLSVKAAARVNPIPL